MSYRVVSALIGISVFMAIIFSLRKTKLQEKHALWWFLIALGVLILGLFPVIIDRISGYLGVHYPPIFLLTLGACVILIKLLSLNISISQNEVKIKKLAQQLALLEKKLDETKKDKDITSK